MIPCKDCIILPMCMGKVNSFLDILWLEMECTKLREFVHFRGYDHGDCFVLSADHAKEIIERVQYLEKLFKIEASKIRVKFVQGDKE